jgi:hypothetical protein
MTLVGAARIVSLCDDGKDQRRDSHVIEFKLQQSYTDTHLAVLIFARHLLSIWLSMLPLSLRDLVLNLLNIRDHRRCVRYDRKSLAPTLPTRSSETLSNSCTAGAVSGPDSTRAYACLAVVRRAPSSFSTPRSSSRKTQRRPHDPSTSFAVSTMSSMGSSDLK